MDRERKPERKLMEPVHSRRERLESGPWLSSTEAILSAESAVSVLRSRVMAKLARSQKGLRHSGPWRVQGETWEPNGTKENNQTRNDRRGCSGVALCQLMLGGREWATRKIPALRVPREL